MTYIRLLIVLVICVVPGLAQNSTGSITGFVTDPSGSVLENATVAAIDQKTGSQRTTTTNNSGYFTLVELPPSTYTVQVSQTGFATLEANGVVLEVGQGLSQNFTLKVGATTTNVTVDSGSAVALDTSDARVGASVTPREVAQLPINGRQISQLYLLAPGAVNSGGGAFDNIRFSGRSNQQNILRTDGIESTSIIDASPGNLNGESTSNFRLQQSLENVQEFRVDSSNYPAEFGTGTGGQISFVTKSGSNHFHGSAFEYLRNDYFDARNYFSARGTLAKLRLNQFGGSVGGPILTDRLFFFGSYEGLRQTTSTPFNEATLSAAARASAVSSIRPLLAAFPVGQFPSSNPLLDIVTVVAPNTVSENSGGLRIDYNINNRFHLYGRFFRDQGVSSQTQNSTLSKYNQTAVPQNGVLSLTQILTPRLFNETKFGINLVKERVTGVPGPSPNANLTGVALNLTGSIALGGIAGQTGSASIAQPTGLIRLSSAFNGRGAPYTNTSYSYIDNLSYLVANHSLKFGVEVRPITLYNDQLGGTTYSYADVNSFLKNLPTSIAFNGDVSAKSPFTGLSGNLKLHQNFYIGYAQDEWKATQHLTVSYGLRYEYYSPLRESRNKVVFFDMAAGTIYPSYNKDWYSSSLLNFGPRLGLTYSPAGFEGKTIFRVGGGYFFGPGQTEDQLQPAANDRIGTTISSPSDPRLKYPLDIPSIYANYDINSPTLGYQPRAYAPNYQIPEKVLSYSASVEQEFPGQFVLLVSYVGSQGRNLFLRSITNKIIGVTQNPATGVGTPVREFGARFAEIDYKTSGGADHYNALQTTLNRRFATGLTMSGQYTWGRSIGNSGGSNEANTAQNPYNFSTEKGRNNFDVRNSLNLAALYELPFGRRKQFGGNISRPLDLIAGNWQVGGILNFRSGVPIDVLIVRPDIAYVNKTTGAVTTTPVVQNGVVLTRAVVNVPGGGASRNVRRPNIVPNVNPYTRNGLQLLNPAAFSIPAPGTFGNFTRNDLSGPNLGQLDLSLRKVFTVTESTNLEFRAETYNVFNHPNFANPGNVRLAQGLPGLQPGQPFSTATAGALFGTDNSTVSNQVGLGTNRQIQLSLRANF
jgi:Carboxypeptidase regulatory-like domain